MQVCIGKEMGAVVRATEMVGKMAALRVLKQGKAWEGRSSRVLKQGNRGQGERRVVQGKAKHCKRNFKRYAVLYFIHIMCYASCDELLLQSPCNFNFAPAGCCIGLEAAQHCWHHCPTPKVGDGW